MTVFQCRLFAKKETLLYSSITTCCNPKGKAQYIKMVVNGWHQLVQIDSTISTQSSPQAKKAAVRSTHCATAAICSTDGHNCGSWSGSTCHSNNQQADKRRRSKTHFSHWESQRSQWDCTAHFRVWCRRDFPEDGGSTLLSHTITYLMTILIFKINDGGGKGQKSFLTLHTVLCES